MTWFKSCAALAAAAALAACAVLPQDRQVPRAAAFDLVGRVAVTDGGRVFTSGMRWQHQDEEDEIWLLTPTGQALAHIQAGASGATLTGADRNQYHASDVESLTRRALGWELPLARLAWWVRGEIVPGEGIGEAVRDQQGRLARLTQEGWNITYVHHAANETGALPQRLDLAREGQQIRLVIDSWRQVAR
jgi:outer membrane lipoprotein LolB